MKSVFRIETLDNCLLKLLRAVWPQPGVGCSMAVACLAVVLIPAGQVCWAAAAHVVPAGDARQTEGESAVSSSQDFHSLLVEAESFADPGGWKLDTQFIAEMGSPYLLAHGLGRPVAAATTEVELPAAGEYEVYVRTKDWVARWDAPGTPGKFLLEVNGQTLEKEFGTEGRDWHWQHGGRVRLDTPSARLRLLDQTGFNGRVDAIYLTESADDMPPDDAAALAPWRRAKLGLAENPETLRYDLVVIGGGYSGMGAALSAARAGLKVALVQNRGVLGGNGSSEVRVWAKGEVRRGKYPRIGEIIEEFADRATKSPGAYEEFGDALKEKIIRAETNIDLFLNHHAQRVETQGSRIVAVTAFDVRSSAEKEFRAPLFVDCTGHGTIGALAGAQWEIQEQGRMGMSNMWAWANEAAPQEFPQTPWALDLDMADFPYPRDFHGQWFWESGFDQDPLNDAEGIRDWNLRAVFGAFNAMKNRGGRADHEHAVLTWVAFIGGPRESRRLVGDVVLTQEDIVSKREFTDGCVPSTWSIDLHYPKEQFAKKYPNNPFISKAVHGAGVDRTFGYPVPYRCLYSANIDNLFMAGRCISVTHEALGTVRVMKTCGMMGEVVGKAAAICTQRQCAPRDVYHKYWPEMDELLQMPGAARRETLEADWVIPADVPAVVAGGDLSSLPGIVVDDTQAQLVGDWQSGTGLAGFLGSRYMYSRDPQAAASFELKAPAAGRYQVRIAWRGHENRSDAVPVLLDTPRGRQKYELDMQQSPREGGPFELLTVVELEKGDACKVTIGVSKEGHTCIDAVQWLPLEK